MRIINSTLWGGVFLLLMFPPGYCTPLADVQPIRQLPHWLPLQKLADRTTGHCLRGKGIHTLMSLLQTRLFDSGYVTTHVLVPQKNLRSRKLILTFLPGTIRHMKFTSQSGRYIFLLNGFPANQVKATYYPTGSNHKYDVLACRHMPLLFSKKTDSSSPYLDKAVPPGQSFRSAEFKWDKINHAGQDVESFNTRLENVKVNPVIDDVREPSFEKHNHLEQIKRCYGKIPRTCKDCNIIHSGSWNERTTT